MTNTSKAKTHREPLFHIVKRDDLAWWQAWLVRVGAIVIAVLLVVVRGDVDLPRRSCRRFCDRRFSSAVRGDRQLPECLRSVPFF